MNTEDIFQYISNKASEDISREEDQKLMESLEKLQGEAQERIATYIRTRLREESFVRKILPPMMVEQHNSELEEMGSLGYLNIRWKYGEDGDVYSIVTISRSDKSDYLYSWEVAKIPKSLPGSEMIARSICNDHNNSLIGG